VRVADAAEIAHRHAEIHVIARDEDVAAVLAELRDRRALRLGDTVTRVDRNEPDLIEVALGHAGEDRVVAIGAIFAIACDDVRDLRDLIAQ